MKYKLQDLIDLEQFQNLQDRLNEICSFPTAIIDNVGNILTATAWQDICTQFHRKNAECEKDCIQSDQYILNHLNEANPAVSYRCPRGLVDNATPIIIDGIHYGNFFTGQFFLEKPDIEFYRTQAKKFGFDEYTYLEAVKKVPIWSKEQLNSYLFFIKGLILIISESGLKKLRADEARKQIDENEERANTILSQMSDGFWITTPQGGQIIDVNEAMCRMLGYTRDEMLRLSIADIEANDTREVIDERIQKIIKTGTDQFESCFRRKDGTSLNVEVSVTFLPKKKLLFGFHHDISGRKLVEEALRESEAKLKKAQHFARVGSWTWNIKTNQLDWSDEMFHLFGLKKETFNGSLEDVIAKAIHPEDRLKVEQSNLSVIQHQLPVPLEYRVIWPDQSVHVVWAEAGEMVLDDAGSAIFLIGTVQDITDRKFAEEEIQATQMELRRMLAETERSRLALLSLAEDQKEAEDQIRRLNSELELRIHVRTAQLEVANKELEAFSYSVSHDLRAPLRGVDGWSLALLEDYQEILDEKGRLYINRIRSETQRMGQLIDDLLSLSRVSRVEMKQSPVNLSQLAQAIAVRLSEENPQRQIEFVIHPGLIETGDPNLLEIMLTNLLSNAHKFTNKIFEPKIEFGKTIINGKPLYFVRDNGAGFDMAYAKKLFGAFQRMHKQTEFPGTGVGLATVQRIINRHGGRVWADAQKNQGATFYFTFEETIGAQN